MEHIIKPAVRVMGRMVLVTIMDIFLCISLLVLFTAGFTEVNGYNAVVYEKDSQEVYEQYTYLNSDGEDTKKAEYEAAGYVVTTNNTRDNLSKGENIAFYVITQIFTLILTIAFIYPNLWSIGTKDSNLVRFKHKEEDKLRGMKVGLVAVIPAVLIMLAVFIFGKKLTVALTAMLFASFYGLIELISGSAVHVSELSLWQMAIIMLLLAIVPVTSGVAYLLGYKDISLGERLIYKKVKTNK